MHPAAMEWIARYATKEGRVLDVGGRDVNGSPRHLFGPDYTVADIAPGPGVNVVTDGATLPFPDQSFDVVVCAEVLEHAPRWRGIVDECARVLRPGGRLIITTAGPGRPAHSATSLVTMHPGEYYANIDAPRLEDCLAWNDLEYLVNVFEDDVRAIAWA